MRLLSCELGKLDGLMNALEELGKLHESWQTAFSRSFKKGAETQNISRSFSNH